MKKTVSELRKEITELEPSEFEQYICDVFSRLGYASRVTQQARDEGVDIVLSDDSLSVGIQVKRYSEGSKVSGPEIQQYSGVKQQKEFDTFAVITSSGFTSPAIKNAEKLGIYTIGINQLHTIVIEDVDPFREVQKIDSPSNPSGLPRTSSGKSYSISINDSAFDEVSKEIYLEEGLTKIVIDYNPDKDTKFLNVDLVKSNSSPVSDSYSKVSNIMMTYQVMGKHTEIFYCPGGKYAFDSNVSYGEEYTLNIEQPPTSAFNPSDPEGSYSGTGNAALGPFRFDGRYKIELVDAESEPVYVDLRTSDGKFVDFEPDEYGFGQLIQLHSSMPDYDVYERVCQLQQVCFICPGGESWRIKVKKIDSSAV